MNVVHTGFPIVLSHRLSKKFSYYYSGNSVKQKHMHAHTGRHTHEGRVIENTHMYIHTRRHAQMTQACTYLAVSDQITSFPLAINEISYHTRSQYHY